MAQAWYAVYCRSRQESRAVWHLRNQGFAVLYPRTRVRVCLGGAWQDRIEPLFPRYAFVQSREQTDLGVISATRGAIGLVRFGSYLPCVPPAVMQAIAAQLEPDEIHRATSTDELHPGDPVCVTYGPFAGALAQFAGKAADGRVAVLLEIMQRQSRVELDPGAIGKA